MVSDLHLDKNIDETRFKIGFLTDDMHMQPRVCVHTQQAHVHRFETAYA